MIQSTRPEFSQIKGCLEKALDAGKVGDTASLIQEMENAKEHANRFLNPTLKHNLSKETIYEFLADRLKDNPPYADQYSARDLASLEAQCRREQAFSPGLDGSLTPDQYVRVLLNPDYIKTALESMLADWGETAFAVDEVLVRHVGYFVKFFALCDTEETNRAIARSRKYLPRVGEVFSQYTLHEDIAFAVPFVESRFTTAACSTAGALGMFQFLASTARDYGLRVQTDASMSSTAVDDRLDWEKTAPAAARYLVRNRNVFASNVLALGAYHHGSMKVVEVLLAVAEKSNVRAFSPIFHNDRLDAFSREYIPQCLAAAYLHRWIKRAHLEALPVVRAASESIREQLPTAQLASRFGPVQEYNPDLIHADHLYCYASTGGYALVTRISGQSMVNTPIRNPVANEHLRIQDSQKAVQRHQEESQANYNAGSTPVNDANSTSASNALARQSTPGAQPYAILYTFQKGNSLGELARTFGVELRTILSHPANRRFNERYPHQPRPGDIVVIPGLASTTTILSSQQAAPASEYRFYTSENQTLRQITENINEVFEAMRSDDSSPEKSGNAIRPELILDWNRDLLPPNAGIDDPLPGGIPLFIVTDFLQEKRAQR